MSLRPIDMQISIPKSVEYGKQQQSDINKQGVDQNVFVNTSRKETEHKQSMVIQTKESEANVNKDGGNKQEYQKNKRQNRDRDNNEDTKKQKEESTGLFDVRI